MSYWRDEDWTDPLSGWDRWGEEEEGLFETIDSVCDIDVEETLSALDDVMQMVADFGYDDLSERLNAIYLDFENRTLEMRMPVREAFVSPQPTLLPSVAKKVEPCYPKKPVKAVAVKARPRVKKGA